ncbi:unnamed protein product, partial [Porites lobata]
SYKWISNTSGKRPLTSDFSRQCSQREVYKRSIPETGPVLEFNMAAKKRAFLVDYAQIHNISRRSNRKSKRRKMYEAERIIERRKTKHVSRFFMSILKVDPFV